METNLYWYEGISDTADGDKQSGYITGETLWGCAKTLDNYGIFLASIVLVEECPYISEHDEGEL